MSAVKSVCPITREEFRQAAEPVSLTLNGTTVVMEPREFSTGSLGWNANLKIMVKIGGQSVPCQLGVNLTMIGSKEAK